MPEEPLSTRDQFVRAGIEVLLEGGTELLENGLTIPRVAERAGFTPTTFGNHWRKPAFVEAILPSLVQPTTAATHLHDAVEKTLIENKGDLRLVVRELCALNFRLSREDPTFMQHLFAMTIGRNHTKTRRLLKQDYKRLTDSGVQAYEAIFARWGATMRKPFSPEKIAITLVAVIEGLTLRHYFDPEAVPEDLVGDIAIALIGSIVDTDQTHGHIDDLVAPIAEQVMVTYRSKVDGTLPDDPRAAVIDAARIEFGKRGYFSTTLTHIATRAGVPQAVLKQLFPTKANIVVGGMKPRIGRLAELAADDSMVGFDEQDIIRRHLVRLATVALEEIEFAEALITIVAHDTANSPETTMEIKSELDLPGIITPAIQAGQDKGLIADTEAASEFAAIITNALMIRCFTRRQQTPEAIARTVGDIMLTGLFTK